MTKVSIQKINLQLKKEYTQVRFLFQVLAENSNSGACTHFSTDTSLQNDVRKRPRGQSPTKIFIGKDPTTLLEFQIDPSDLDSVLTLLQFSFHVSLLCCEATEKVFQSSFSKFN